MSPYSSYFNVLTLPFKFIPLYYHTTSLTATPSPLTSLSPPTGSYQPSPTASISPTSYNSSSTQIIVYSMIPLIIVFVVISFLLIFVIANIMSLLIVVIIIVVWFVLIVLIVLCVMLCAV